MDIIDIMLARAMTPQGQTDTYVAKANAAAAKAEQAEADAAAAIATVTAAAEDIADAQAAAQDLLADAQEALETAQQAQINTLDLTDVDDEIKQLALDSAVVTSNSAYSEAQVILTYPDDAQSTDTVVRMYKSTGTNEDATMTQKAITDALATKATTTYVDNAIANIPGGSGGSGNINVGPEAEGHLLTADENGNVIASTLTEEAIIESMLSGGSYVAKNAVGLEVNYAEKTCTRIQEAASLSMGADFNKYPMYGGRMRCNVADNGTINAFYGQSGYTDDGSNGQVMVYQPKFYYQRLPLRQDDSNLGKVIRREIILVSATAQTGFKLHPLFKTTQGEELDYVLLPAYNGSLVNSQLASISGQKPVSNISITQAESYATARGDGWHITNMAAESAQQMLEIVEFGTMNGQGAFEDGISNITGAPNVNCSSITGSTASLGNITGHATSTTNEHNGTTTTYTTAGQRAISYRGVENPWGNIWRMIGGINIYGNGASYGGAPYICTDFNYNTEITGDNYQFIGFYLPSSYGWISAMGYSSSEYDWVFLPIECTNGSSLAPVGDNLWTTSQLRATNVAAIGGTYDFKDSDGPFYYACDRSINDSSRYNYGANLMFIPTKNSIYTSNINKWNARMGG